MLQWHSFLLLKFILFCSRSLYSLKLSDNHLDQNFAKVVFSTLLNASFSLSILDLSENNVNVAFPLRKVFLFCYIILCKLTWILYKTMQISGWLSQLYGRSQSNPSTPLGVGKSLQSLRVLNLRFQSTQLLLPSMQTFIPGIKFMAVIQYME